MRQNQPLLYIPIPGVRTRKFTRITVVMRFASQVETRYPNLLRRLGIGRLGHRRIRTRLGSRHHDVVRLPAPRQDYLR